MHGDLGGDRALEVGGPPHVNSWQSPPRLQGVPGGENETLPALARSPRLGVEAVGQSVRCASPDVTPAQLGTLMQDWGWRSRLNCSWKHLVDVSAATFS